MAAATYRNQVRRNWSLVQAFAITRDGAMLAVPPQVSQEVPMSIPDAGGFASLRRNPPPRKERYAIGRGLRQRVRRSALGDWEVPAGRADVVAQVIQAHEGRLAWLIPVRIGRMSASPYAFLRGVGGRARGGLRRAAEHRHHPVICGDAHLGNFGFYASPERDLVFDLNDFDEAHPGAWEWDLRRLVASAWVAGRDNDATEGSARRPSRHCVTAYRKKIARLAERRCWPAASSSSIVDRLGAPATQEACARYPRPRRPGPEADHRPGAAPLRHRRRRRAA